MPLLIDQLLIDVDGWAKLNSLNFIFVKTNSKSWKHVEYPNELSNCPKNSQYSGNQIKHGAKINNLPSLVLQIVRWMIEIHITMWYRKQRKVNQKIVCYQISVTSSCSWIIRCWLLLVFATCIDTILAYGTIETFGCKWALRDVMQSHQTYRDGQIDANSFNEFMWKNCLKTRNISLSLVLFDVISIE